MNCQTVSYKSFGMVMVIVALLLVACGNGEGDAEPSPTAAADRAVPTLPSDEATAQSTGEISEEDLTVITPNIARPADATQQASVSDVSEAATATVTGTPDALQGARSTPIGSALAVSSPADTAADVTSAPGTVGAAAAETPDGTAQPSSTPTSSDAVITAGDGTGGSGQPGERSSNLGEPDASPFASPVAAVEVEGCDVTNIPPFTGTTANYVTNDEVYFRQGPGAECTPVYEAPLEQGQTLEVIGGPVSQATDDSIWLQVEIEGVPGWVSLEFAEPADEAF